MPTLPMAGVAINARQASAAHNQPFHWQPGDSDQAEDGVLTVTTGRKVARYVVSELVPAHRDGIGRLFSIRAADGSIITVFVAADPDHSTCDCPHARCLTIPPDASPEPQIDGCWLLGALASVLARGWLPDPRVNPEQDVGATDLTDVLAILEERGELPASYGGSVSPAE